MLTPREKSPFSENVPRGGSNPRRCGQRAQTLPTSCSGPSAAVRTESRPKGYTKKKNKTKQNKKPQTNKQKQNPEKIGASVPTNLLFNLDYVQCAAGTRLSLYVEGLKAEPLISR